MIGRPDYPTETPPSRDLDAVVARFMGYEVKPLAEWPDPNALGPWWPAHDQSELMRSVWVVEDPEDACAFMEAPPHTGKSGRFEPRPIQHYSSEIKEAWPVYLRIRQVDPTAMVGERMVYLAQDEMGPHEVVYGVDAPHAIALAAKFLFERARAETKQLGETK